MAGTGKVGVGIIGAGVISTQYLDNLTRFPDVQVHAIGDLFPEAAKARAEQYGIAEHGAPDVVLNHPDIEIVVNLTIPAAHVEVATQAVNSGKHVWSEKPFSMDRPSGQELLALAAAKGIRLGCAPDTFLGAGLQTARRMLERGDIGEPQSALTLMQSPGPESWHPNPAFLFQEGAGPLFDIGPYYLTALVQFFGSIARVGAFGSRSRLTRTIGSGPKAGEEFDVTVPTHVSAIAEFASGQTSQSIWSFDSFSGRPPLIEITGTEGVLSVPDPNMFDGEIGIRTRDDEDWRTVPSVGSTDSRGAGVLEMARAIRADRPHRAPGEQAFHVVDAMTAITESIDQKRFVDLESSVAPIPPLPEDWDPTAETL
ncbi:Gfo/Idh/MocA family protein [Schumannella sp. 10F1B-5-1]|uniref:Gfo/Idh/MocA family protein n=1 Tax=Schumannella sp. 10F1B-5-1 TaxID=2590780 RepID=UPI0011306E71|nr:Gfo/Idh/MocA family oxidoreductase [Schumannella sp. 10F1B-5-1]TPW73420.1 Gfo/Idh/MocA family oxidoreductase [Schumannella sp. 10F1B-5-1]